MHWETILIILLVVHWLCDFTPASTPWMLAAKKNGWPIHPIFCHAATHALFTLFIFRVFTKAYYNCLFPLSALPDSVFVSMVCASLFILFTHWFFDIVKGMVARFYPSTGDISQKGFWVMLGLDQLAHTLMLVIIASRMGK